MSISAACLATSTGSRWGKTSTLVCSATRFVIPASQASVVRYFVLMHVIRVRTSLRSVVAGVRVNDVIGHRDEVAADRFDPLRPVA